MGQTAMSFAAVSAPVRLAVGPWIPYSSSQRLISLAGVIAHILKRLKQKNALSSITQPHALPKGDGDRPIPNAVTSPL